MHTTQVLAQKRLTELPITGSLHRFLITWQ